MPRERATPVQKVGAKEFLVRIRHDKGCLRVTVTNDMAVGRLKTLVGAVQQASLATHVLGQLDVQLTTILHVQLEYARATELYVENTGNLKLTTCMDR
jgi:hypothetical protein